MNTTKTAKHLRSFWRKDLGLLAPSQLEALPEFIHGIETAPSAMIENVLLELDEIDSPDESLALLGWSVVRELVPYAIAHDIMFFDPYNGLMIDEMRDGCRDGMKDPSAMAEGIRHLIEEYDAGDADDAQPLLRWADILELFDAMRCDICVMAEHGDSDDSLLVELINADSEIRSTYRSTFCEKER